MSKTAEGATPSRPAWQPFSFGGLAAFAKARLGRLLIVEFLCAVFVASSVVWFLSHTYWPVILHAIQQMPATARIADGHLSGCDETVIAERKQLAIAISPDNTGQIGQSADIQIQFRKTDFRIGTVFEPDWGLAFDYAPYTALDLSRSALEPWWGAWNPVFLTVVGVGVAALLFVTWAVVALFCTWPAKFLAWFADRSLSWIDAWRLSCAALLPGAFLVGTAIILYGLQAIDLIGLGFFWGIHLLASGIYLAGGVWACPRLSPSQLKQNPFTT
jgi:hypothetical protein